MRPPVAGVFFRIIRHRFGFTLALRSFYARSTLVLRKHNVIIGMRRQAAFTLTSILFTMLHSEFSKHDNRGCDIPSRSTSIFGCMHTAPTKPCTIPPHHLGEYMQYDYRAASITQMLTCINTGTRDSSACMGLNPAGV
jgi:hypothetical protein